MNGEQPNQALRSEVERSLREKERRLATLLSNLPGMAYRCRNDSNWTMEFVSDGCVALTGYPAADLVSGAVPYNSLIHPNDRERVWNEVQDALQQGLPFRFTYRIRSAHGRETWVWEQGVGVYSGGELEALEGFITDITDRKNTEANLEAQRERFQKIVENTDAGYFRIGLDGCYEDVNQAWARMHGFARREDAIGLNASAVQVPEDLSRAYQVVDQLMNGEAVKSGEFTRLRRDGSIGYHTFSANPVLDGDRVVGIEGFLVDTTGLKSAEQERRQTEQRYRSLFGSMQEGVAIHKLIHTNGTAENYILLDVNRRYEKILGVRREDVVNKAATEAYGIQGAPYLKVYSSVVATGTPLQFETYFAPMDKHFVISVAPMGDDLFATIFFDVTEWKRTQQAIQQANEAVASAERHYRLMFNSVSDAVFVHRFDEDGLPGHFVDVNDNACRHLGYAREELLRMGPCDIDDPEEHAATLARAQRLRLDGHGIWEGTHVAKDGRRIPVEVNTSLVDLDGTQTMISCARDISKRKEAEKRWREIFDGALEGIYRISTQKKIVAANSAMARMVGYDSPEELVSSVNDTTEQLWLNPDDRDRLVALLEGQGSVGKFECQFKRKDSTAVPVSINVHRVCGADGRTLFYDGFVQDITERKRAEETLRENEERHRSIVQTAMEGFWLTNIEGRLLEVNETYCRMSGYSAGELLTMRIADLVDHQTPEETASRIRSLMAQGEACFESRHRRKDGSTFDVEANVQFRAVDGGRFVCFLRDVTERRRAEAEKTKLEDQLRQAQKLESVGRLAGGVAHDFNNLLTVINGYSGMLLNQLKVFDPLHPYALEIKNAGERAATLTKQLLAFSRKQVIEPRVFDLNTTIRQSAPMLQRLIGEDIALGTHLGDSPGQVLADPDQIHQVIMNLAVNARDAMPSGGRLDVETANVELGESDSAVLHLGATPGRYVLMTVTDTGDGMDAAIRERIFEPFFTTKEVGKGTGLGLSTVYGIIRQSGGWIDVWSETGVGSSFKVYLPRLEGCSAPEETGAGGPTERGNETLLLVEDQKAVRSYAGAALRGYGYRVIEASNGGEAMAAAGDYDGEIHLLLSDVVMPGISGKELAERLKDVRPGLKVLFMSGYTADVIAQRGVLDGSVAFLHKPFSPIELAAKVRTVLTQAS